MAIGAPVFVRSRNVSNSGVRRPRLKAVIRDLHDIAGQLADLILWLETGRREPPDDAVLSYVRDAVSAEIRHRRRMRELAGALAAIERSMTPSRVTAGPPKAGPVSPRPAPVATVQPRSPGGAQKEAFYRALLAGQTPVHLRCRDGYEVPSAIVRCMDAHALLVETGDGAELFLKRSVISIGPLLHIGAPGEI